jgi:hypothetical protein
VTPWPAGTSCTVWLSTREAAEHLGVTAHQVRRLIGVASRRAAGAGGVALVARDDRGPAGDLVLQSREAVAVAVLGEDLRGLSGLMPLAMSREARDAVRTRLALDDLRAELEAVSLVAIRPDDTRRPSNCCSPPQPPTRPG